MENNNRTGSVAVAFLLGAMAGGIAALLFTPRTGAQMRHRLRRGAHDLRERGADLAHEAGTVTRAMKGAAFEARNVYRDELDKRGAASGAETKRHSESETADDKPRAGAQA